MPPKNGSNDRNGKTEADIWRTKAIESLERLSKAMQFFLFAAAELTRLTTFHAPDDFSHCKTCKQPWPCETMDIVSRIGEHLTNLKKDTND